MSSAEMNWTETFNAVQRSSVPLHGLYWVNELAVQFSSVHFCCFIHAVMWSS